MKIFLFILLLTAAKGYGQSSNKPVEILDNIKTKNPANYKQITNTNVWLIPPKDFVEADMFSGLKFNDSTIIICTEIHDKNQIAKLPPMDKPVSEQNEIKIIEFKKITVNGAEGAYVSFQKDKKMNAYQITFGDESFRVIITATVPVSNSKLLKNEILTTFNSIYYDNK
jgi:hypothetical protein